jgi:large subunit ribosomal protein L29
MKNSEIKDLTTQEIIEKIEEEKKLLVRLRINHKVSNLDNPHKISESKRFIARLKTELRKRELSEERA